MQGVEDLAWALLGLIIDNPHVMVQLCLLCMCISSLDQCIGTSKGAHLLLCPHLHLMLLPKIHMALIRVQMGLISLLAGRRAFTNCTKGQLLLI